MKGKRIYFNKNWRLTHESSLLISGVFCSNFGFKEFSRILKIFFEDGEISKKTFTISSKNWKIKVSYKDVILKTSKNELSQSILTLKALIESGIVNNKHFVLKFDGPLSKFRKAFGEKILFEKFPIQATRKIIGYGKYLILFGDEVGKYKVGNLI